jgi:hypothetical protein
MISTDGVRVHNSYGTDDDDSYQRGMGMMMMICTGGARGE